MIVKKPEGFYLMTQDGSRSLGGPYKTREEAIRRENQVKQIEWLTKIAQQARDKRGES
jgi:hypothetical protein